FSCAPSGQHLKVALKSVSMRVTRGSWQFKRPRELRTCCCKRKIIRKVKLTRLHQPKDVPLRVLTKWSTMALAPPLSKELNYRQKKREGCIMINDKAAIDMLYDDALGLLKKLIQIPSFSREERD